MTAFARFGWTNWIYLAATVAAYLLAAYGVDGGKGPDAAGFGKAVLLLWLLGTALFVLANLVAVVIGLVRRRPTTAAVIGAALPFALLFAIVFLGELLG